jgi:parvulin-like peptidyl-prolyl cis-trans isomerase-like protein
VKITKSWLAIGIVAAAGCAGAKDMFRIRADTAAEAAGQELSVERLATLASKIKGFPVTLEAEGFLANLWVDHTLLAEAIVSGRDVTDSAHAALVMWPEISESIGTRWHDSLMAHRAPPNPQAADSIYQADQVRILQHILFKVDQHAEPPVREAQRKKAEATLARVKGGASFGALAAQLSDDYSSKNKNGYLPPSPRGRWVTAFDSAGWSLAPGAVAGPVETPFGYHIIRRPPESEVSDQLLAFQRDRVGVGLDSMYLDSLAIIRDLKVLSGAPAAMRSAFDDRDKSAHSSEKLVTYNGGQLTLADFIRWTMALGPQFSAQLQQANDSALRQFARVIGQNTLLLAQAESAGVRLSPAEWQDMMTRYRAQVDSLRAGLDLVGSDLTDTTTSRSERQRMAMLRLDATWDRIAAGTQRPRPLPPALSLALRDHASYRVSPAGLQQALERTQALKKAETDSMQARPPQLPPRDTTRGKAPPTP